LSSCYGLLKKVWKIQQQVTLRYDQKMILRTAALTALFMLLPPSIFRAQSVSNPSDALLDVLVWGTHVAIDPEAYDPPLKNELQQYLRRAMAYRPRGPVPTDWELRMSYDARIMHERRLAAVSDNPMAPELAAAYVKAEQSCYEWEGFHDCPEREARFADDYQAAHPNGPFSTYLPLLAAQRWLCTAEAYEYEHRPADAARSRRAYEARLELARRVKDLLFRTAAERLAARGRCFPAQ
jgi:hypothetical protein